MLIKIPERSLNVVLRFRDFSLTITLRQKPKRVTRSRRRTLYCNCSRMRVTPLGVSGLLLTKRQHLVSYLLFWLIYGFTPEVTFLVSTLEFSLMTLHAVWRCFMQLDDASCSLMMLHAALRCFMQLEDASCSLKMLHAAWWCFILLEDA